jgi:hypothetical protein
MRWCLAIKLAQNFRKFGAVLESTGIELIVEESRRDKFWGAKKTEDGLLVGVNALGRLLMELREQYGSEGRYNLLYVPPLDADNFKLLSKDIEAIDERENFLISLLNAWDKDGFPPPTSLNRYFQPEPEVNRVTEPSETTEHNLAEPKRESEAMESEKTSRKTESKKTKKSETRTKDTHNTAMQPTQGRLTFPDQ